MPPEHVTFEAVHPAAVAFVPARGRVERTELVRLTTPVAVRRVEEDAFEPIPDWGRTHPTYRHEGAFWSRIARGPSGEMPYAPEAFGDVLARRESPAGPMAKAMRGTPLLGWGDLRAAGAPDGNSPLWSGHDVDLDRARSVVRDGRPAAIDALHRHVAGDYRVTRGHVYRRRIPLADCEIGRGSSVDMGPVGSGWRNAGGLAASPETYEALMRMARVRHNGTLDGPGIPDWLGVAADGSLDGEEHRAIANAWPGWLRRRCDILLGEGHDGTALEGLRAMRPTLFSMEVAALTGTCGEHDLGQALRAMRGALGEFRRFGLLAAMPRQEPALEALDTLYLPSLPELALAEADSEALDALVPGAGR